MANERNGTEDSLQTALQDALEVELPKYGNWTTVWGPTVWKVKPTDASAGPENSWFVGYNPLFTYADGSVHPTYVVAVAGTPPYDKSNYAWMQENFAVDSVADFATWVKNGITNPPERIISKDVVAGTPYVAMGTVGAVYTLLTKPAPLGSASAGNTLIDFLAKHATSDDTRIVFTGHSLGGCLSPTLALSLVSSGTVTGSSVLTYPTAGPSPGNRAFADLFASTFPAQRFPGSEEGGYQVWNLNIYNSLDIVPQAWCAVKALSPDQNLLNIPAIFGPPAIPVVQGITLLFILHTLRSGVIYIPLQSHVFRGVLPASPPTTVEEYLVAAFLQHMPAYWALFAVPLPTIPESKSASLGLVKKTKEEQRYVFPVIANFEYAAENPEETQEAIDANMNAPEAKEVGLV